jgi:hypothetical protein
MYAQRKASPSQTHETPTANVQQPQDLQDQMGNSFLTSMLAEMEPSGPTSSATDIANDIMKDDDVEDSTDTSWADSDPYAEINAENRRNAAIQNANEPEQPKSPKIPVAHDGWSKGEDGWNEDSSVKTPISGKTHERGADYANEKEDASSFRGDPSKWTNRLETPNADCTKISTKMMEQDEASKHDLSVKDGKVMQGEKPLDTNDATGIGTYARGGKGRHIYASGEDGKTRSIDPWAEHEEHEITAPPKPTENAVEGGYYGEEQQEDDTIDQYKGPKIPETAVQEDNYSYDGGKVPETVPETAVQDDSYSYEGNEAVEPVNAKKQIEMKMANHSTMVDGKKASGAGEIKADDGEHVILSDRSGHYKPDNEMLYNTSRGLTDQGLSPEATTVELTNKTDPHAKPGLQNGDLQASALEFQSYGGSVDAEKSMRQEREDRKPVMDDIKSFDKSTLSKPEAQSDRSAPMLETTAESINNGDRPSLKNRARVFGS